MTIALSPTSRSSYTIPNSVLIKELRLIKHPEGGHFVETDRQKEEVPSPFAGGEPRPTSTTIHYLLTADNPHGVFHMNKSATMHVLHQGRAEYTLVTPSNPPKIEKRVMGFDIKAGEVLQLLVGTGVWKMSRILEDDLAAAKTEATKDRCGCLITEVVFPGFVWQDHAYLTREMFDEMFSETDSEEVKELAKYVKQ